MMSNILILSEQIDEICDLVDIDPESVRTTYSGRGMNGDTCVGVVGKEGVGAKFLLGLAQVLSLEEAKWLADRTESDNMGLDVIFYWRKLVAEE